MGNKKDKPKIKIFLILEKNSLKELNSLINSHKQRKANSIATGILMVKVKPKRRPTKIKVLTDKFELLEEKYFLQNK